MPHTLIERIEMSEGASKTVSIDGTAYLEAKGTSVTFSSVDSVTEITTSDLTLGAGSVNAAELLIKRRTVAVGKAIQFSVSGQQSGTNYRIRFAFTLSDGDSDVFDIILPGV